MGWNGGTVHWPHNAEPEETERERINISTTKMSFRTGACSRQINQCPHTIIIKLWAYRVNYSLSLILPSLSSSHRGAFSLTHSLLLSSIRLSLIVCLSRFCSPAPCDATLDAEDPPRRLSPVYTGTDGRGGNVRLVSESAYGPKRGCNAAHVNKVTQHKLLRLIWCGPRL